MLVEFFAPSEEVKELGVSQLIEVADTYDPSLSEAALTIGHPQSSGDPAYGFVERVLYSAGKLYAKLRDYDPLMFAKPGIVQGPDGRKYKQVSAAFFRPDHPHNPTPGRWYLDHIAILGAIKPRIPGLVPFSREVSMSAEEFMQKVKELLSGMSMEGESEMEEREEEGKEGTSVEAERKESAEVFSDWEQELARKEKELAAKEKELFSRYAQGQIDLLLNAGKITQDEAPQFLECAMALAGSAAQQVLFDTLNKRPPALVATPPTEPLRRERPATEAPYAKSRGGK